MLKLSYQENDINTANLYLQQSQVERISKLLPSVVSITGLFAPERKRVESFIKQVYAKSYGADISVDYPMLMSVQNTEGKILATVGFRYAEKESLFLENYTEKPIEEVLKTKRSRIVEIGNLASDGKGASIFLFAALSSYLNSKSIEYASITGTDYLHSYFSKIGLSPQKICEAHLQPVQDGGQDWGTYYDTQPRVLVGSVENGVKRLKRLLGAEFEDCRPRLLPRLHYKD